MAINVGVAHTSAAAGIATDQTFSVGGFNGGANPTGAIFILSYADADNTARSEAAFGIGFVGPDPSSGTNEFFVGGHSTNNVGSSQAWRRTTDNFCIGVVDPTNDNGGYDPRVDASAAFKNWTADGITVTWTAALTVNPKITCILIGESGGGSDLSLIVDEFTTHNSIGSATAVTTVGFELDMLLLATAWQGWEGTFSNSPCCLGVAINDDSSAPTQCGMSSVSQDGQGTSAGSVEVSDTYALSFPFPSGSSLDDIEIDDIDASGFDAITRTSSAASPQPVAYMAIAVNGTKIPFAQIITTKAGTGTQDYTTTGVDPDWLGLFAGRITTTDTLDDSGDDCLTMSVGASDGTNEGSSSWQDEDGEGTTDTQSMTDAVIANCPESDGTAGHVATVDSLGTEKFTLDHTTNDGNVASKWVAFGWGDATGAPAGGNPWYQYNQEILAGGT